MSSINSVGGSSSVNPLQQMTPIQRTIPADAPAPMRAADRVELSGVSHLLKSLQKNDVRTDKVASIKAAIANGTYEDDHKLDVATDRLLDELLK